MIEATIKRQLVRKIKERIPNAVIFRHEDKFTHGIPDISITANHTTVWVEVKYLAFKAKKIQILTAMRLANVSHCFFAVFSEYETLISHPDSIMYGTWREGLNKSDMKNDYDFIIDEIIRSIYDDNE